MHKKVPQKSTTKKVQKRVHRKVQKKVHKLLKVPKKGPKKVLFLKIVPKIALLKALFGDQNLYAFLACRYFEKVGRYYEWPTFCS